MEQPPSGRTPRTLTIDEFEKQAEPTRSAQAGPRVLSIDEFEKGMTVSERAQQLPGQIAELDSLQPEIREAMIGRGKSSVNNFLLGVGQGLSSAMVQTRGILEQQVSNAFSPDAEDRPIASNYYYLLGQQMDKELNEIFPTNPAFRDEFWAGMVANGAGRMLPQLAVAVGTGGIAGAAGLGAAGVSRAVFGASTLYNASLSSDFYNEAIASGADEDTAFQSMLLNMAGTSALEALPMARMVSRINKATGGSIVEIAKAGFKGSVEEGITEGLQQFYSNVVAKNMYDDTRNLFEGVGDSMLVGGLLGGVANASMTALFRRKAKATTVEEVAAVRESLSYIQENYGDMMEGTGRNDVDDFFSSLDDQVKEIQDEAEAATVTENGIVDGSTVTPTTNSATSNPNNKYGDTRSAWKKFADKWLSAMPFGNVEAGRVMEEQRAFIRGELEHARLLTVRLNQALFNFVDPDVDPVENKMLREGHIPPDLASRISEAMVDKAKLKALPKELRVPVRELVIHINKLTGEMVKAGIVQGEVAIEYLQKYGSYLHKSYKMYEPGVKWDRNSITDQDWNAAIVFLRNKLIKMYAANGKQFTETQVRREAEYELQKLIARENTGNLASIFQRGEPTVKDRGDTSILQERKDIAPEIEKVMGVHTDPIFNYIRTIEHMSNLVGKRVMFDRLAEGFTGTGKLFLTEEEKLQLADTTEWNYKLNTNTNSKLDKLFMHKDLYDYFMTTNRNHHDQPSWLTAIYRLNAASKYSKTVLSHVTASRNIVGGLAFMTFNGLFFNTKAHKNALRSAKLAFFSMKMLDARRLGEKRVEYERLNLTGKSLTAREIMFVMNKAHLMESDSTMEGEMDFLSGLSTRVDKGGRIKHFLTKLTRGASAFYKAGDDFIRIYFYELEKARLQKADPSMTDQQVAHVVNDLYQNYDRLGKGVKFFQGVPLIAPFLSFPAEVVRTAFNTGKRAHWEISKSGNKELAKIGWSRVGGMVTTTIGVTLAGAASQALLRITDKEDQAYREFMPAWDKNSILVYLPSERGVVRYINTSYTNPYAYLVDPIFTLTQGGDDVSALESFIESLKQLMEPVLSPEIAANAFLELRANKKETGGEVYNPQDDMGTKAQKIYLHLWNAFEPGSMSSIQRMIEPLMDRDSPRKATDELAGLFGMRPIPVDITRSFGFSIRSMRSQIRDTKRVYNSVKFDPKATPEEVYDAYERSNKAYEEVFNRMVVISDAAQLSGSDWADLEQIMKDSGLAQRDINAIASGVFAPFEE